VLLDSARNYYFRKGFTRKYVTLLTDLGRVFAERGDYELALNNLYDALKIANLRGFDTEALRHTKQDRLGKFLPRRHDSIVATGK
jgi:hypothetical protein